METNVKFVTIMNATKTSYGEIPSGCVVMIDDSLKIVMANPKCGQYQIGINDLVVNESSDRDLIKAWHHSTIERKYGKYATRERLKGELMKRGYSLSDSGHRWKKQELAI